MGSNVSFESLKLIFARSLCFEKCIIFVVSVLELGRTLDSRKITQERLERQWITGSFVKVMWKFRHYFMVVSLVRVNFELNRGDHLSIWNQELLIKTLWCFWLFVTLLVLYMNINILVKVLSNSQGFTEKHDRIAQQLWSFAKFISWNESKH